MARRGTLRRASTNMGFVRPPPEAAALALSHAPEAAASPAAAKAKKKGAFNGRVGFAAMAGSPAQVAPKEKEKDFSAVTPFADGNGEQTDDDVEVGKRGEH